MSHNVVSEMRPSGETPTWSTAVITILHEVGGYRGAITLYEGERLELEFHQQPHDRVDRLFERHVIERHGHRLRWELYTEVEDAFLCDGPFAFNEVRVCDLDHDQAGRPVGFDAPQLPRWTEPTVNGC